MLSFDRFKPYQTPPCWCARLTAHLCRAPMPRTNAANLIKTQLAGCAPTSTFVNRPGAVKAATTACFGLYAGGQRSRTFGDAHGRVLRRN